MSQRFIAIGLTLSAISLLTVALGMKICMLSEELYTAQATISRLQTELKAVNEELSHVPDQSAMFGQARWYNEETAYLQGLVETLQARAKLRKVAEPKQVKLETP